MAHIIDAARQILAYTEGMDYGEVKAMRMAQDAVIRQFEIIGEAAKNLSQEFRTLYEHVPWRDLAGFRDKLIHQYFGVDLATVWRSVEADVPILLEELARIKMV